MKRTIRTAWAVTIGLLCFNLLVCGDALGQPGPPPGDSVVCRLEPGEDPAVLAREYGLTLEDSAAEDNLYRFRAPEGQDPAAFAERLRQDPRFAVAEHDAGVRTPEAGSIIEGFPIHLPFERISRGSSRYALLAAAFEAATPASDDAGETAYRQVGLQASWSVTRGDGVIVAVLDTGVEANHPSLRSRLLDGYNAITPDAAPDDVADGVENQALGHGTMVAGIIARVAPEAKILPIRVLSADGSGSVFDAVRGLRWARAHGAQVVNLSFGVAARSAILQDAVEEALREGVVIVAAAGNAGQELPEYPAALRNVVAVASVEADGARSAYSNFGAHISLCAPGTKITSTFVNGEFATWSGTSFSAPIVSGAAALLRSARPGMPNGSVAALLRKTARSVDAANPGLAGKLGRGVLNIDGAVASSDSVPCPRPSSRATKQGR